MGSFEEEDSDDEFDKKYRSNSVLKTTTRNPSKRCSFEDKMELPRDNLKRSLQTKAKEIDNVSAP